MKALIGWTLAGVVALGGLAQAGLGSDREKLIGAWRLVSMEEPGADGKLHHITDPKGMLLYTRDGDL